MNYMKLPVDKVELDIDNPRIKQYIAVFKQTPTSKEIALALIGSSDSAATNKYIALRDSIKENKGIFTPIIVNHITAEDRYVVIEGNTRLRFYQEFLANQEEGEWSEIIAIVYDDMDDDEIHAIRLQAHMVGARDWDAFSKAKYLDYLYNTENKSMEYLKVFCGGQESYIRNLINAYKDMNEYYIPEQELQGISFDPQVFSYYAEAQKNSCKQALTARGYSMNDFSKWVISEKIDRAESVRKLAKVLNDDDARETFLKDCLSQAIRVLDSKEISQKKLEKADLYKMMHEVALRTRNLPYTEVESLKKNPKFENKKEEIVELGYAINDLIEQLEKK